MKKCVCVCMLAALLTSMMVVMTSCNHKSENLMVSSEGSSEVSSEDTSSLTSVPVPSTTSYVPSTTAPTNNTPKSFSDKSGLTFADLKDMEFGFGNGIDGFWSTTLKIQSDGTFNGYCSQNANPDLSKGTKHECYLSGKFSSLKKTGAYTYSMKCVSLKVNGDKPKEYGFDNANDFFLYLPGLKASELPEDYLGSTGYDAGIDGIFKTYGLYNVGGKEGFTVISPR